MKSLVFSVALNGYDRAFRQCLASHKAYASRIGADHYTALTPVVPDPAFAAWMKLTFMARALDAGYTHVAYIDADCEVKSGAGDFASVLEGSRESLLMARGRSGRINSGVIFARTSEESRAWLDAVIASATEDITDADRANLRFENGNIIAMERRLGGVGELSVEWNNTFDPELDDYIRHYTGPLKPLYRRSAREKFMVKLAKLRYPKAQPAPQSRSAQFLTDLAAYTEHAWNAQTR